MNKNIDLLEIVANAMQVLLIEKNFDTSINKALKTLGEGMQVDRIYIFKNNYEKNKVFVTQLYEWASPLIEPQINNPNLQNLDYEESGFIEWYKALKNKKIISGLVKNFTIRGKQILIEQGIKSLVINPIFIGNCLWGLIGFDDCHSEKIWNKSEKDILLAMASSIGGAINNKRNKELINKAKNEALKASVAKSQFLANMSHEIRTPLNSVLGVSQILYDMDLDPEIKKYVSIIERAGNNLLTLINDILDISKIESGSVSLNYEKFDFRELLETIKSIFCSKTCKKNIDLIIKTDENIPQYLSGDDHRIKQILINLIGNAIKFTEKGKIEILTKILKETKDNLKLMINVKDTGIGISSDKVEKIFNRFSQEDESSTKKYGGTGLGLAITKGLVELMGGKISVKSVKGKGSDFCFTINLEKIKNQNQNIKKTNSILKINSKNKILKILLADDSPDNRMLIEIFLKKEPIEIIMAKNGEEALEKYKNNNFDLILMDMQMPVMDGYNATKMIRKYEVDNNKNKKPIIALTAYAYKEDVKKSLNAGCNLHLTKPIKKDILIQVLKKYYL